MIERFKQLSPASVVASTSLIGLIILLSTTNPVDRIGYAMLFFLLLLIFLNSSGLLLLRRFRGQISSKGRYRLLIVSIFLVILLMFRSAQSLGWLEIIVLLV